MELFWDGKEETIRLAKTYIGSGELIRIGGNSSDSNMFLATDNANGLHFLRSQEKKKADLIYIDPPYQNYHTTENQWMSDIYFRLSLGAEVMGEDALIFISINDRFQAQLRLICNEIFGSRNFVAQIVRKRTEKIPERSMIVRRIHEYILVYAKNIENYLALYRGRSPVSTWWDSEGYSEEAREELAALVGESDFTMAKPVRLIKKCIQFCPKKDALVLDFYAGSGTTAQAVLELNGEDGGNRSFILIQREETGGDGRSIVELARRRIHAVDPKCQYSFYGEQNKQ